MIDDYKYMYLYTPYILNVYRMMLWIFDFFCVLGVVGCIRILALGLDALILPLVRNLYKPLPFQLGCCYDWRL